MKKNEVPTCPMMNIPLRACSHQRDLPLPAMCTTTFEIKLDIRNI